MGPRTAPVGAQGEGTPTSESGPRASAGGADDPARGDAGGVSARSRPRDLAPEASSESPEPGSTSPEDAVLPPNGPYPFEPSELELKFFARVLLHVDRQPRLVPGETAPDTLSQAGIAKVLGTTQANVSHALKRLVDGGALRVDRGHVRGQPYRLKVYQLTSRGEALVLHIRKCLGV
jgi:hypothetical protein